MVGYECHMTCMDVKFDVNCMFVENRSWVVISIVRSVFILQVKFGKCSNLCHYIAEFFFYKSN